MRTLEYVKNAIEGMGVVDLFGTKKEVKELPSILHDNEELLYITSGLFDGNTWLIAATSERVIFLDKGFFFGLKQIETPLEKINSIGYSTGLLMGEITIWDGASPTKVEYCNKETLKPFVDAVNAAKNKKLNPVTSAPSDAKTSTIDELERLAVLKEKGILNEEEFLSEKKKILSRSN